MRGVDILSMCVKNLWKRKLRTVLTMLGVIVGTAALVLTVSLGLANEARFDRMLEDWDRDLTVIEVMESGGWVVDPDTGEWSMGGLNPDLDDAAIASFLAIPEVRSVAPFMGGSSMHIRAGAYAADIWNVQGVTPEGMETMGSLMAGRFIEDDDPFGTVVVGAYVELAFEIMGTDWMNRANRMNQIWSGVPLEDIEQFVDMLNEPMLFSYDMNFTWRPIGGEDFEDAFRPIRSFPLNVVGVLDVTGNWSVDQSIFMDIETAQEIAAMRQEADRESSQEWGWFSPIVDPPRENYDRALVRVYDVREAGGVAEIIREMGFNLWFDGESILRRQEMQQGTLGLLIAIAAVSIFVAAISIANTMIMAVYERTREIGVMKVIGGSIKDIRRMFLLEAAMIGFLGGIIGVGLSLIGSYVMNTTELEALTNLGFGASAEGDVTSLITLWLMGAALAFASIIGLVSGYFPARRATKLSALEAIRTD